MVVSQLRAIEKEAENYSPSHRREKSRKLSSSNLAINNPQLLQEHRIKKKTLAERSAEHLKKEI
jgi:hypothetical protein